MKFECEVEIDLNREETVKLWEDPENLVHWQDGFVSFEDLERSAGAVGAKSRMLYDNNGRKIDLTETILENNLPDNFKGLYEAKEMTNTMNNRFVELGENRTKWISEIHYTNFNGFIVKAMAFLFPSMFKKQVQKWMDQFKAFVEK